MWKEYDNIEIKGIQCAKSDGLIGKSCADLCVQASRRLMERYDVSASEIGIMIYVTQSPMFLTPSTSFYIHKELGIGKDCFQYDTNQGATGFLGGLQLVASLMQGINENKNALLLIGDDELLDRGNRVNLAVAVLIEKNVLGKIFIVNHAEGAAFASNFKMNDEWKIHDKFSVIGNERLNMQIQKVSAYAEDMDLPIARIVQGKQHDSAVRLPFQLCEERVGGNILMGTFGAGICVMTAICKLTLEVYAPILEI